MNKNLGKNDYLIEELINDKNYKIFKNGTILTKITKTGKVSINNVWRELWLKNAQDKVIIKYKKKNLLLHRVIYRKFIGKLIKGYIINHKDYNPFNNHKKNLEQITISANNIHRFKKHNPVFGNKKISFKIAEKIRKMYKTGKYSYNQLKKKFNIKSKSLISYIINEKVWKKEEELPKHSIRFNKKQPKWADLDKIKRFYKNKPKNKVIDHIIPLNNPNVSGLHVIENLQYLSKEENRKKGNSFDFTSKNNFWKKNN